MIHAQLLGGIALLLAMTTLASPEPVTATTRPASRSSLSIALELFALAAVVATGFFLASVPARNASLFAHLAGGRDFSGSPTWLFDAGISLTERVSGFGALVVLKTIWLAAFVGLTVWATVRAGASLRVAVYCAIPAALAVTPFVSVEPATLTPLLFAAALALLLPETMRGDALPGRAWLVVPLVVVWAGSAEFVLLGPVTVFCRAIATAGRGRRGWALLAAATLVAAFVSPDPLRAIRIPGLTTPAAPEVFRGEGWAGVVSPLGERFRKPTTGYGPAGVALALAILAPFVAFARPSTPRSTGLILVWAVTVVAALAHWWAIPLAACAAAVVIGSALGGSARELHGRRAALAFGLLTLVWSLAMPLAAWAGWLQPPPYTTREWRVDAEPSLQEAAETLANWEQAGRWPGAARAFVCSPEAGDHLAWFAPGQRPTLTSREVAGPVGVDHAAIVRALTDPRPTWDESAREVLRRYGTTHLVLFHPDAGRFNRGLTFLLRRPDEFPPLLWRGRVVVLGWRDPAAAGRSDPFPAERLDLSPNASSPDWRVRAPDSGPVLTRRAWSWHDVLSRPPAPRTADRDEAAVALTIFEFQRQQAEDQAPFGFEAMEVAGLIGAAATGPGVAEGFVRAQMAFAIYGIDSNTGRPSTPFVALGMAHRRGYETVRAYGPIGTLLRGVRAGRRAVAANPDDAAAYQALAECYLRLRRVTAEHRWADAVPTIGRIRLAQVAFAGRQALRINPDLPAAHAILADLYGEVGFNDAALRHARELARLRKAAGPAAGEDQDQYRDRLKFLEEEVRRYEELVSNGENAVAKLSGSNVAQRAAVALANGLAEKALRMLLDTDVAAFGPEGAKLELGLLLDLGRADEAREWLTPDYRATVGAVPYHAFRAQAAAAVGDYTAADEELAQLARAAEPSGLINEVAIGQFVGQVVVDGAVLDPLPGGAVVRQMNQGRLWNQALRSLENLRIGWGLGAQRAWLLLERGDYDGAELRAGWALRDAGSVPFPGRPVADGVRSVVRGGQ
jgi:hypothetical protein